jgi:hypothetical protein
MLPVGHCVKPAFLLKLDDISDGSLFDGDQGGRWSLFVGDEVSLFDEFGRAEEGTDVFGLERGGLFERGHGEVSACMFSRISRM